MFINGKKDSLPRKRKTTILSEILYGGSQRLTVQGYRFLTAVLSSLSNEVKLFFFFVLFFFLESQFSRFLFFLPSTNLFVDWYR